MLGEIIDAEFADEPKLVRHEHKIDERHCLVFEAKQSSDRWRCRCTLVGKAEDIPFLGDLHLMSSGWSPPMSADHAANTEREWVARFRGMGK